MGLKKAQLKERSKSTETVKVVDEDKMEAATNQLDFENQSNHIEY